MYVRMYVCMHACLYVCVYMSDDTYEGLQFDVTMLSRASIAHREIYVYIYIYIYHVYVCMYVCMKGFNLT